MSDFLVTEADDFLITESGDFLITESGSSSVVSGFGSIVSTTAKTSVTVSSSVSGFGQSRAAGTKDYSTAFLDWFVAPANDIGRRCILAEPDVMIDGVETTRYLSNTGYTSTAADTPANQLYTGRISGGMQFTRRLDLDGSGSSISFGDLELDNEDGSLDDWLNDVWAGRAITIPMGEAGDVVKGVAKWPRSAFEIVFSGTTKDIFPKARNRLSLVLRDIFGPLNDRFSTATVGGTGDNKDVLLPVCLGECFNVTPVLVDSATQQYAVHIGEIESIIEVRDNGIVVAATADTTTGTFTLTNARYGQITCDVQGAKINNEWRNDAGGLIEWVATVLGDGNVITASQIDITALRDFRDACPQPLGLYITDGGNRLAIMQQLAASVGATVTTRSDGKMILVRIGFGESVGSIGTREMIDGTFAPIGRPQVTGAVRLNAEKNWTPDSMLSGAVTAEQVPILTDEYVVIADSDATVVANWNQSGLPVPIENLMVRESDIEVETARRLALSKIARTIFSFEGFPELLDYDIGDTTTLTHPRFGLSAGVPAQIVGVTNDWLAARVRLEVLANASFGLASWNDNDRTRGVTLSASDKTATLAYNGSMVRTTAKGMTAGKFFQAFTVTTVGNLVFGFVKDIAPLTVGTGNGYLGSGALMIVSSGNVTSNLTADITADNTGMSGYSAGDTGAIAIDLINGKAWLKKNDTWFNSGDPEAGTNPQWTWTPNSLHYGLIVRQDGATGGVLTLTEDTPPTGYIPLYNSAPASFVRYLRMKNFVREEQDNSACGSEYMLLSGATDVTSTAGVQYSYETNGSYPQGGAIDLTLLLVNKDLTSEGNWVGTVTDNTDFYIKFALAHDADVTPDGIKFARAKYDARRIATDVDIEGSYDDITYFNMAELRDLANVTSQTYSEVYPLVTP
jgi:hypothetical protein